MNIHTIDAKNARLGKVATEAARHLMGKNSTGFAKNVAPKMSVRITNAGFLAVNRKKLDQKQYVSYSGYPGGLKIAPIRNVIAKKGYKEVLRKAVKGMLPKNKLQAVMMNNLTIEE
ncbi:uL13 family ribosomal protein [bacterium]|nr:uL13 family ribosomal protein [bacterium]